MRLFALLAILTSSVYAGDAMRLKYTRGIFTGHGTAFAISKREVLTCAHNVLPDRDKEGVPAGVPMTTIQLEVGSDWIAAEVVRVEPETDLALLRVSQDLPIAGTIGEDVDVADDIYLCCSLRGAIIEKKSGSVLWRYHRGSACSIAYIEEFDHGGSGSPVYNSKDQIVGMARALPVDGNTKRVVFLPASVLKWFLKRER